VKFIITPRAWRQVERERKWWEANRDKAPGLFAEELAEAERHLTTLPESRTEAAGGPAPPEASMRRCPHLLSARRRSAKGAILTACPR
jgi:hypothetical protein